jgi:hypothetical protein
LPPLSEPVGTKPARIVCGRLKLLMQGLGGGSPGDELQSPPHPVKVMDSSVGVAATVMVPCSMLAEQSEPQSTCRVAPRLTVTVLISGAATKPSLVTVTWLQEGSVRSTTISSSDRRKA